MPTYDFACPKCKDTQSISAKISEYEKMCAPSCVNEGCDGIEMDRVFGRVEFQLIGKGWARDGYAK